MKYLKIGTRKSLLALWQAHYVRDALLALHEDIDIELVEIITEGDRTLDVPLYQSGGKGLFLKELESSLITGDTDIAIHSMKDVTIRMPDGLHIPVVCPREDPRDAFVSNNHESLESLPEGAVVGTCSLRRQCQIKYHYPHLKFETLRGNINTRLKKLDAGYYDAIILAAAGLKRLDMESRISEIISTSVCLPAVGQGVVGVQCRERDGEVENLIAPLNDPQTALQIRAERAANAKLDGGCHVPVAIFCELEMSQLKVRGLVGEADGSRIIHSEVTGTLSNPEALGETVAQNLLDQGAGEILNSVLTNG